METQQCVSDTPSAGRLLVSHLSKVCGEQDFSSLAELTPPYQPCNRGAHCDVDTEAEPAARDEELLLRRVEAKVMARPSSSEQSGAGKNRSEASRRQGEKFYSLFSEDSARFKADLVAAIVPSALYQPLE
ncbi:hypothetical protein AMECASPLE_020746 [Ameca splendens]|uniref:Uncharacterized protein n=1 Tax=Ameca splendens TaxID=208324 RepID=A0ABV0ZC71_9TELE